MRCSAARVLELALQDRMQAGGRTGSSKPDALSQQTRLGCGHRSNHVSPTHPGRPHAQHVPPHRVAGVIAKQGLGAQPCKRRAANSLHSPHRVSWQQGSDAGCVSAKYP